ncbi:MAG: WbuC family cupin fold metalloprotein [Pseudomonadota bacterium]
MSARVFSFDHFTGLHDQAKASPRLRQHLNIHASHAAPFQRLFIAFGLDSYVRPHRHHLVPKDETLVAVQGLLGLLGVLVFDNAGQIVQQFKLGTQSHAGPDVGPVVDMPAGTWHTVLALTPDAVLLEGKAGPFDPQGPREFAYWAPEEGTDEALVLLQQLRARFGHA